jgi:peptide/nickel transport system substrate-binding protein
MGFNTSVAPFNDVRVRHAIDLAIDRSQFNQATHGGSGATLMGALDRPGTAYYDPNISVPKQDLVAAQQLIDQVVAQTGKPIQFTYTTFNVPNLIADAEDLQAQVSRLKNVQMKLDVVAIAQVTQKYTTGNYQATQFTPRWNVPAIDMVRWFSSTSPFNYMHYSNPQVDADLSQLVTSKDQKTQVRLVQSVEQQVLKDSPVVWYVRFPDWQIYDKTVQNYQNAYDEVPLLDGVWLGSSSR